MKFLLIPMIKNITLISSESGNYRPNPLSSATSKSLELILQNRKSLYMYTSDTHLGFKASHGTDMTIFFL